MVDPAYIQFEERKRDILSRLDRIEAEDYDEARAFDDDAVQRERDEDPRPIRQRDGECSW